MKQRGEECPFYREAQELFKQGKFELARDTGLRSVSEDFSNAYAWALLVPVYEAMNEPEHALEAARQAKRSMPDDIRWLSLLGKQLLQEKHFREALDPLEQALEIEPEHSEAGFFYALALYYSGKENQAEEFLQQLLLQDKHILRFLENVPKITLPKKLKDILNET